MSIGGQVATPILHHAGMIRTGEIRGNRQYQEGHDVLGIPFFGIWQPDPKHVDEAGGSRLNVDGVLIERRTPEIGKKKDICRIEVVVR